MAELPEVVTPARQPRTKLIGNNRGLTQAYDFRDFAAEEAMRLKDEVVTTLQEKLARAKALQALAVVWTDASDRIRILRGRPLPGSLKPEPRKPKVKPIPQGPLEG